MTKIIQTWQFLQKKLTKKNLNLTWNSTIKEFPGYPFTKFRFFEDPLFRNRTQFDKYLQEDVNSRFLSFPERQLSKKI